jgi:hypothetical protein
MNVIIQQSLELNEAKSLQVILHFNLLVKIALDIYKTL